MVNNSTNINEDEQLQYSQRHSVINHCGRYITLHSDTDIFFDLFNLFTYLDMPFG